MTHADETDEIFAAARKVGERPAFFDDPAVDQLLSIVMAMSGELSVLYDRVDTLERLLEDKAVVARDEVETYVPPTDVETERKQRRTDYIRRLLRIIREDGSSIVPHDDMNQYQQIKKNSG